AREVEPLGHVIGRFDDREGVVEADRAEWRLPQERDPDGVANSELIAREDQAAALTIGRRRHGQATRLAEDKAGGGGLRKIGLPAIVPERAGVVEDGAAQADIFRKTPDR